jgi:2-polyprenyl-6-methoxyphenol hydroxylase-like FAD-dependent oxidoreductase
VDGIRVAVVGAGIAGLSAAAFLARAGIACTVYEQAPELREVGAGIQLSPNGSRLLHRIGLAGHLSRVGVRPAAIELRRWRDDATIARTELGPRCVAEYGAPYYTLHRADLHGGLRGLAGAVRTGRRCVGVVEHPDRVELRFADGTSVAADLVVGADGLHSVVRKAIAADPARFSGMVVHRGLIPAPESGPPRVRIWLGPGGHVVCYPVSGGRLNVVVALPASVPPGALGPAFAGWHPAVRELVSAVDGSIRWELYDRAPLARWGTGRVVLAGDAAHPMLPFGAQGANQAIEDAAALATCLRDGLADVPGALRRYERLRVPRVARVTAMVKDNAGNHHLPDGVRQRRRDRPMRSRASLGARAWLYGYDAEAPSVTERTERSEGHEGTRKGGPA